MSAIHSIGVAVHGIVQTIKAIKKTYIVAEAGVDVFNTCNNQKLTTLQKTHRVATNSLVIALQGLEVEFSLAHVSPLHQLDAEIGVGVADLLKVASRISCKEKGFDSSDLNTILNTAAFRGLDVAGAAGDCFPNQRDLIETGTEVAQALLVLLNNRQAIAAATRSAGVKLYAGLMFLSCKQSAETSQTPAEKPDEANNTHSETTITLEPEYLEELQQILRITTIEDLLTIPTALDYHETLREYLCPITKKPIRTIVVTHRSKVGQENVYIYYEKTAIINWIRERPLENPPGWPEEAPLNIDNPHFSTEVLQDMINKNLRTALKEFRKQVRADFPNLTTR